MVNKRRSNKNSKKVPMIVAGIVVLMVAVAVGIFMSKGKTEDPNEDIDIKESTKIAIEQKVEYGDDIKDKTFTVNTEDGEKEASFTDLDPEVDTMKIGKTEHKLEIEEETFDVSVVVEDTKKPIINGVKEVIEFEGEEVNVEKELKKLITAEDLVDGELEVTFKINEDEDKEGNYNVTAEATDENGNKTTEEFEVVVKIIEKKEENSDNTSSSNTVSNDSTTASAGNKSSSSGSGSKAESPTNKGGSSNSSGATDKGNSGSTTKQPEKAKPTPKPQPKPKPKPEAKPEPKPQPNPGNNLPTPPSGATLIMELPQGEMYSYNKNLPGGGSIDSVGINKDAQGKFVSIGLYGLDSNGINMSVNYNPSTGGFTHNDAPGGGKYTFTAEGEATLKEVYRLFAKAYGM